MDVTDPVGFTAGEITTGEPTRAARLKWVIVTDESAPAGLMVNAVACTAASTGAAVRRLIGPSGSDAAGVRHPGLPWAGCTVLTASPAALAGLRAKAAATDGVLVVDMPASAQTNRSTTATSRNWPRPSPTTSRSAPSASSALATRSPSSCRTSTCCTEHAGLAAYGGAPNQAELSEI